MAGGDQQARGRAIDLIRELRSGQLDDDQLRKVVTELNRLLPDPNYFAYTIDHEPELPAEEVVSRAFLYRPIIV